MKARVRDGVLRHRCSFPHWFTTKWIERGDEWVCYRCRQVWIATCNHPFHAVGDWKKLRAGFWRRPVRRPAEREEDDE
jgi:hypothetical protein